MIQEQEVQVHDVAQIQNENQNKYLSQLIHRMALCCECCFFENRNFQAAALILIAKVIADETNPAANVTSRVPLCQGHFDALQTKHGLDLYQQNTGVNMEILENHFKTAKKIKPITPTEEILQNSLQETSSFYCCRVLRQRYLNIIKQIQQLQSDQFEASKKAVVEQKKIVLRQTEEKFKLYLKNKDKISLRQKFLMLKWYERMEEKSKINIAHKPIQSNLEQSILIASKTMYLE